MSGISATVIATFSRRMRLRLADDREVDARIKGKRLRPVCGDHVRAEPLPHDPEWLITTVDTRLNELTRPDSRGNVEVLAANIDYMVVVVAAEPGPDWFIVDRYLCAAELMDTEAAVVYNKIDLATDDPTTAVELEYYAGLGYDTARCSAVAGHGVDTIETLLKGRRSIIVGQSGVGKSSIINALVDEALLATAAISDKRGEGRHTTVNSMMISLPTGGEVIDSPGVRDYAPALDSSTLADRGFREIAALSGSCRFSNCRHLREPGCAVKAAVEGSTISARRYESYKRIVNLTRQLAEGRY